MSLFYKYLEMSKNMFTEMDEEEYNIIIKNPNPLRKEMEEIIYDEHHGDVISYFFEFLSDEQLTAFWQNYYYESGDYTESDDSYSPFLKGKKDEEGKPKFYGKKSTHDKKGRTKPLTTRKLPGTPEERQKTVAKNVADSRNPNIDQDTRDNKIYKGTNRTIGRKQTEGPKWWEKKSEQADINQAAANKREKGEARGGW